MQKQIILVLISIVYVIADVQKTTYTFKTVGDLDLFANVYLPNTTLYDKLPVVFTAHGGGYVVGDKDTGFTGPQLDEILSRGWAAVSIDYRLAPGALINEIIEDVQDAYTWVRNELIKNVTIDPDCITVFGDSAGGGIAVISGYKLTPRPKSIISFCPFCTNFADPYSYNPDSPLPESFVALANSLNQSIAEYITFDPADPRLTFFNTGLSLQKYGWALATHDPNEPADQILKKLTEFSAVYNIDADYPPTYVAHGLADNLVPYNQSVQLGAQLESKNISYILDLVPGAGHSFDYLPVFWQDHVLPAFDFAEQYMTSKKDSKTGISV